MRLFELVGKGVFVTIFTTIFTPLVLIPIMIYGIFSYGVVASYFWQWFIVPIFEFPVLNHYECYGIIMTLSIFRPKGDVYKETRDIDWGKFIGLILAPWILLTMGYIFNIYCL